MLIVDCEPERFDGHTILRVNCEVGFGRDQVESVEPTVSRTADSI